MGCMQSKDAVKAIQIESGEVKTKSAKSQRIKVASAKNNVFTKTNTTEGVPKSTSAKSRDSGIQEMDSVEEIITEDSNPHLIKERGVDVRPETPNFELVGTQFSKRSAGRVRSKAILAELEAQGLISGAKFEKGGAAFEVQVAPHQPLEPLAPIKRPPPRLERMKTVTKLKPTKEELEKKMKEAEERRQRTLNSKSRLASQLSRDQEMAKKLNQRDSDNGELDTADNIDHVTRAPQPLGEQGRGEDGFAQNSPHKASVFDESSLSDLEDNKARNDSRVSDDDFFGKTSATSRHDSLTA